jgi:hypothetical protein
MFTKRSGSSHHIETVGRRKRMFTSAASRASPQSANPEPVGSELGSAVKDFEAHAG